MKESKGSGNIYLIQISGASTEQVNKKFVGYSAGGNEYDALRNMGFRHLHQMGYEQNYTYQDEWKYVAGNAVNCFVYATKI